MERTWMSWLAAGLSGCGMTLVVLGILAFPRFAQADTGPSCNEGGDPSMPIGCFGACDSPKICEAHPIHLICTCR
jgi:hypothetical protein